jgi:RNA polymerase sigma-70 factor (ECF subfamily)
MALDIKIISDCKRGKSYAQERIYDLYSAAMLSVCARYAKNITEAEDILQESFIKVFTKISKYDFNTVNSFSAWIKRIVINTALNHIRDNKKHNIFSDINEEDDLSLSYNSEDNEVDFPISQSEILELVQNLPIGYKLVFNLYVFEKYTHQDIAIELNISVSTSKTQLFKARRLLQKKILEKVKKKEYNLIKHKQKVESLL